MIDRDVNEHTFVMIKPNAVAKNVIGEIIAMIEKNNFVIGNLKMLQLTKDEAEYFYRKDKDESYFWRNIRFMTSGPVVAMTIQGANVIARMRELIGATDPKDRATGTIRYLYGDDITRNAIHASDSRETASEELGTYLLDWCN